MIKEYFLRLAKELTQSTNIDELITSAKTLEANMVLGAVPVEPHRFPPFHAFVKSCHLYHLKHGPLPFHPYPYQDEVIRTIEDNLRTIVVSARQMGMSYISVFFAAYSAASYPNQRVIFLANTYAMACDLARRLVDAIHHLDLTTNVNKDEIRFKNNSVIEFKSYNGHLQRKPYRSEEYNGDGFYTHLVIDQADFMPQRHVIEAITRLKTRYATAKMFINFTPAPVESLGTALYRSDDPRFEFARCRVSWDQHPERNESWINNIKPQLGAAAWRREYECEFVTETKEEELPK